VRKKYSKNTEIGVDAELCFFITFLPTGRSSFYKEVEMSKTLLVMACIVAMECVTLHAAQLPVSNAVAANAGQSNLTTFATANSRYRSSGTQTQLWSTVGSLSGGGTNFLGSTVRIWETTAAATVTQAWRNRAVIENSSPAYPLLPPGAPCLISDVVKIGGTSGAYALQMNYSQAVEGTGDEAYDAPHGYLYLAWLDTTTDANNPQWVNAANSLRDGARGGPDANGPYQGSWAEFRASHSGALSNYVGYWGVDIENTNASYDNSVWAVVNHNGIFAAIPEPSTVVLLSVGAIVLLAWAWRKGGRSPSQENAGQLPMPKYARRMELPHGTESLRPAA
jgi:hypothetical protein